MLNLTNEASGNKFQYTDEQIDWGKLNIKRKETDLYLLTNREAFIKAIEHIFHLEGKDSITKEDLWDFNKSHVSNEYLLDNSIIIDCLRQHEGLLSKTDAIAYYEEDEKWDWFKISTLVNYDTLHLNTLGEKEIQFIHDWCQRKIKSADFKKVFASPPYRYMEFYLAYWISRFDFEFDKSVYLDLLWINSNYLLVRRNTTSNTDDDNDQSLSDYVVGKVGVEKVMERVSQNLSSGVINESSVFRKHIKMCVEYNQVNSLSIISKIITERNLQTYDLIECCNFYLQLGGEIQVVENILEENTRLDKFDRFQLIDLLLKYKSSRITNYLIGNLNKGNEELELTYAKHLIELGRVEGLAYYLEWMTKRKKFDDFISSKLFMRVPLRESIPLLLKMVDLYFIHGFDREYLHNQDQELLETVCIVAAPSKKEYEQAKTKFEAYLEHPDGKQLYFYLRRLDALHHNSLTQSQSLKNIADLIDKIQ